MKNTNANVTKQLTILTSAILSLIFAFAVSISFIAINNKKDVFTVCNDDEYYSETTYFLNEKEYEKYLRETGTERDGEKSAAKRAASAEQDGEIFVQAAVKKVWVAEAKDDSGNVVNSRLMKKAEIDKIDNFDTDTLATSGTEPPEYIGGDSESKFKLDISMSVLYDQYEDTFLVYGNAYWEAKLVSWWDKNESAEEDYNDYLGITWGGKGEYLKEINRSIEGVYHNDEVVSFSRKTSEPYAGYVWQFREKSGWMGKEMKNAHAMVELQKVYAKQNLETAAKLTYIHTYGDFKIVPGLTINVGPDIGVSAAIGWEDEEKSWQIEIAVAGLKF